MTTREFLNAITTNDSLSAEIREFAAAEIGKMDGRNEARKAKPSKEQLANMETKRTILAKMTKPMFAAEIATACGITVQKASGLCVQLVKDGSMTVEDVKVKGHGTLKRYAVATSPAKEEA